MTPIITQNQIKPQSKAIKKDKTKNRKDNNDTDSELETIDTI